jgi:hypothetical protein
MFEKYDYVVYTGKWKNWKEFYSVEQMNQDGTVFLRGLTGGIVSDCPAADVKMIYRPTQEEIVIATSREGK